MLTNGKVGSLQGTILAGYLFVWHYGLEERSASWQFLCALGMKKRNILSVSRGEMLVIHEKLLYNIGRSRKTDVDCSIKEDLIVIGQPPG